MVERSLSKINTVVIHCAATPNGRHHDIKDIDQWHKERGFKRRDHARHRARPELNSVGYHYVIRTDGALELGRSVTEVGAHAKGNNSNSVGVCLIGTDKFTEAQWLALRNLVKTLQETLPNLTKVLGHYELDSNKTCPCFDVAEWRANGHITPSKNLLTNHA